MLEIKKVKTETGEVGISFVIQTTGIKQKYSEIVSVFSDTKEQIYQRIKLVHIALQVLRANPDTISLEKKGKENQFSFAWKDDSKRKIKGAKNFWCVDNSRIVTLDEMKGLFQNSSHSLEIFRGKFFKIIKKAHLVIQNNKKKIVKVATGVSAIALIVCASAVLMPFINANNDDGIGLCSSPSVDVDVVLVMDTTKSMQSVCTYSETCNSDWSSVEHKGDEVTQEWCDELCETNNNNPPNENCKDYYYCECEYESKIDYAKDAAKAFVYKLGNNDKSALVSFNNNVAFPVKSLSSVHSDTRAAIEGLTTGTTDDTNIGAAISMAKGQLDGSSNSQAIKVVILLTDGEDLTYVPEKVEDYKIFTIGLGNDVDGTMLSSIAELTGAKKQDGSVGYYPAADGSELADIYDQIATAICAYGSISGCKYLDADADSEITEAEKLVGLPDWEINLTGAFSATQQTDETGCYTFAGLLAGEYTVSETLQDPWQQTYPEEDTEGAVEVEGSWSWQVTLEKVNNKVDNVAEKHFANYYPCDDDNVCTDDNYVLGTGCVFTQNSVECDDNNLCTENDVCLDGVCSGTCTLGDPCDDNNPDTMNDVCTQVGDECVCVGEPVVCYVDADCDDGESCTADSCVDGVCQHDDSNCPIEPVCGNGILEQGEECDGDDLGGQTCASQGYDSGTLSCSADCAFEFSNCANKPTPPSGGGGAVMIPHSILDVRPTEIVGDSVTITWRTSFFATSQVIYSVEGETHEFDPDNPPLYGYAHMTPEQDTNPKVTFHTVVIPGLSPEQTYYYRTISRASPAVFSNEFTFTTLASLEEDDASETDEPSSAPADAEAFVGEESAPSEKLSLEEVEEKLNEISNKVATIGQEVAKISPEVNLPAFASVDSDSESLAYNDLDSEEGDEEPLFADATTDEASFAEASTDEVNNEINDELDDSKFLAGIGTFFSNLEGWRLALIFLLGIILALIILRLIRTRIDRKK